MLSSFAELVFQSSYVFYWISNYFSVKIAAEGFFVQFVGTKSAENFFKIKIGCGIFVC